MFKRSKLYKKLYKWKVDFLYFGYLKQLYYYLRYRNSKVKLNLIFIYCNSRTGSTLLSSALANSSNIYYNQEIFRKKLIDYKSFVTAKALVSRKKWLVIKIKPMHLKRMGLSLDDFLVFLNQHNTYKISLTRACLLRQVISGEIAKKRGLFISSKNIQKNKVDLDASILKKRYWDLKRDVEKQLSEVDGKGFIAIEYQKDLNGKHKLLATISKIYNSIDIIEEPKLPMLKKVVSHSIDDEVNNWKDIENELAKSGIFLVE